MDSLLGGMFVLMALTLVNSAIMIIVVIILTVDIRKMSSTLESVKNLLLIISRRQKREI